MFSLLQQRMSKKRKLSHYNNPENYFSVSKLYNYFTDDTLIDYLDKYGKSKGYYKNTLTPFQSKYNFKNFIMNLGSIYEQKVVQKIISLLNSDQYKIVKETSFQPFEISYKLTQQYLDEKIPVIFQAYLNSEQLHLHGYVDILVRTDFISKLFDFEGTKSLEDIVNYCFQNKIDYLPIDIKISNFDLNLSIESSSSNYHQFIYAQMACYIKMLNEKLNCNNNIGFLLGKQFIFSNKLQLIKLEINDSIFNKIIEGINWLICLENEGLNFTINPPSRKELFPNMKNNNNLDWSNVKSKLAFLNNEITCLYYIGIDKRNIFLDKNINSFLDKNFINELKNIFDQKSNTFNIISSIIEAQKNKNNYKFKNQLINIPKDKKYIYIDIETVYNHLKFVYDEFTPLKNEFIVQVGIGFMNEKNDWIYKSFDINKLDEKDEAEMLTNFKSYIYTLFDVYKEICFVHYTSAEDKIFNKIIKEGKKKISYDNINYIDKFISYLDLHNEFTNKKLFFKGLFNFKLKNIIEVLNENNFIKLSFKDLTVKDGLTLMTIYLQNPKFVSDELMNEIRLYNEYDCLSLYELHKLILSL